MKIDIPYTNEKIKPYYTDIVRVKVKRYAEAYTEVRRNSLQH